MDVIKATKRSVQSVEGSPVVLSCTYSSSANNLQWYRQNPGSTLQFLLLSAPYSQHVVRAQSEDIRLNITFSETQVNLEINSAEITDSALYYCALEPTLTQTTHTAEQKLHHYFSAVGSLFLKSSAEGSTSK